MKKTWHIEGIKQQFMVQLAATKNIMNNEMQALLMTFSLCLDHNDSGLFKLKSPLIEGN